VWLQTGFWITGFINHFQVITTNNCNTIADFYTLQIIKVYAKSFPARSVFTRRFLLTASNNEYSCSSVLKSSLNGGSLPAKIFFRVRVSFTLRLEVYHQFILAASPLRLTTSNFIFQLNTCGYSPYVINSLTRGWVYRLQLLLVLASAVILGSDSRGTHGHILLSQIRDSSILECQVAVFISPRNWVA
jgi:hypothetical protein